LNRTVDPYHSNPKARAQAIFRDPVLATRNGVSIDKVRRPTSEHFASALIEKPTVLASIHKNRESWLQESASASGLVMSLTATISIPVAHRLHRTGVLPIRPKAVILLDAISLILRCKQNPEPN